MGKKIFLFIIILIILSLVIGTIIFKNWNTNSSLNLNSDRCKIEETRKIPVSLELAKSVGEDYLPRYYPEFDWIYVGNYLVYNSFGDTNYHLLIFRKSEFLTLNTLEKLEQNAKLFSDSNQDESAQKYQFGNIATIMTGSMKEDKLIQRHYRGIPEAIGKKIEIKEFVEDKYSGKTIGSLITDSPMGTFYYEIIDKNSKKLSGNLITLDFSIISRSNLIKNQEEIQERKDKTYSTYGDEECEKYQNTILEREKAYIAEWKEFE